MVENDIPFEGVLIIENMEELQALAQTLYNSKSNNEALGYQPRAFLFPLTTSELKPEASEKMGKPCYTLCWKRMRVDGPRDPRELQVR